MLPMLHHRNLMWSLPHWTKTCLFLQFSHIHDTLKYTQTHLATEHLPVARSLPMMDTLVPTSQHRSCHATPIPWRQPSSVARHSSGSRLWGLIATTQHPRTTWNAMHWKLENHKHRQVQMATKHQNIRLDQKPRHKDHSKCQKSQGHTNFGHGRPR